MLIPLIAIGAYFCCSLFFFFFPHFLHPRKNFHSYLLKKAQKSRGKGILHISHRGGSREALENSIEALSHSLDVGANIIELDVQFTKDKTIVLSNDDSLSRLCGVDALLSQRNYRDLPNLALQVPLDYSHDLSFCREEKSQNYFTTIEETFLRYPTAFLMLDLKNGSKELAEEINNLMIVHERETLTIWGDSSGKVDLEKVNRRIPRFFPDYLMWLVFFSLPFGLLPFLPLNYEVFSWPLWTSEIRHALRKSPFKFCFFKLFHHMSQPVFKHLQKRGILVFTWVLNYEKEFKMALQRGVNGIITDSPTELKKFLDRQDLYIVM